MNSSADFGNPPLGTLTLGTAQLGTPYGVANQVGQLSSKQARDVVAAAWEGGVRDFDTAPAYGDSEAVLGQCLRELSIAEQATVITKVPHLGGSELSDRTMARSRIHESVEGSLRRLGVERIDVILFHREPDARHLDALLELRERGWLARIGVSCGHDPATAARFAGNEVLSAVQVPANALDRRHIDGGVFRVASDHHVAVYVRSIYLQGLLAMPARLVPAHLAAVLPAREVLEAVADEGGITVTELALRAMLGLPGRVSLLIGAETVDQVVQNCAIAAKGPLPRDMMRQLELGLPLVPDEVLTPFRWPELQTRHH